MGILDTLLSLLGRGSSSSTDEGRETTVSVEREADAETEAAIKGTDADANAEAEASAAGTDAAASTGSLADERGTAAEPAEAVDTGEGGTELDTVEAESRGETTAGHEATADTDGEPTAAATETEDGDGDGDEPEPESVEVIKGIGPAYAERLSNAGVDSVADLAAADVSELAAAVDLSETRVGRWIERAQDR